MNLITVRCDNQGKTGGDLFAKMSEFTTQELGTCRCLPGLETVTGAVQTRMEYVIERAFSLRNLLGLDQDRTLLLINDRIQLPFPSIRG